MIDNLNLILTRKVDTVSVNYNYLILNEQKFETNIAITTPDGNILPTDYSISAFNISGATHYISKEQQLVVIFNEGAIVSKNAQIMLTAHVNYNGNEYSISDNINIIPITKEEVCSLWVNEEVINNNLYTHVYTPFTFKIGIQRKFDGVIKQFNQYKDYVIKYIFSDELYNEIEYKSAIYLNDILNERTPDYLLINLYENKNSKIPVQSLNIKIQQMKGNSIINHGINSQLILDNEMDTVITDTEYTVLENSYITTTASLFLNNKQVEIIPNEEDGTSIVIYASNKDEEHLLTNIEILPTLSNDKNELNIKFNFKEGTCLPKKIYADITVAGKINGVDSAILGNNKFIINTNPSTSAIYQLQINAAVIKVDSNGERLPIISSVDKVKWLNKSRTVVNDYGFVLYKIDNSDPMLYTDPINAYSIKNCILYEFYDNNKQLLDRQTTYIIQESDVIDADNEKLESITKYYLTTPYNDKVATPDVNLSTWVADTYPDLTKFNKETPYLWTYEKTVYYNEKTNTTRTIVTKPSIIDIFSGVTMDSNVLSDVIDFYYTGNESSAIWYEEIPNYTDENKRFYVSIKNEQGVTHIISKGDNETSTYCNQTNTHIFWNKVVEPISEDKPYFWRLQVKKYLNGKYEIIDPVIVNTKQSTKTLTNVLNMFQRNNSANLSDLVDDEWREFDASLHTPTKDQQYVWQIEGLIYKENGTWKDREGVTTPHIISQYNSGNSYEYVYLLNNSPELFSIKNITPSDYLENEEYQENNYVPSGWSTSPLQVTTNNKYLWLIYRIQQNGKWGSFLGDNNDQAISFIRFPNTPLKPETIEEITEYYWCCNKSPENIPEIPTLIQNIDTKEEELVILDNTWTIDITIPSSTAQYLWNLEVKKVKVQQYIDTGNTYEIQDIYKYRIGDPHIISQYIVPAINKDDIKGEPGQSIQGCVIHRSEYDQTWLNEKNTGDNTFKNGYYNDMYYRPASSDIIKRIDVVYYPDTRKWYMVKARTVSNNTVSEQNLETPNFYTTNEDREKLKVTIANKPINIDGTLNSEFWVEVEDSLPIRTPLIMAENALFEMTQSSEIILTDANSKIVGGLSGHSNNNSKINDIRIFAGTSIQYEQYKQMKNDASLFSEMYFNKAMSPFKVYQDGKLVATDATITGAISNKSNDNLFYTELDKGELTYKSNMNAGEVIMTYISTKIPKDEVKTIPNLSSDVNTKIPVIAFTHPDTGEITTYIDYKGIHTTATDVSIDKNIKQSDMENLFYDNTVLCETFEYYPQIPYQEQIADRLDPIFGERKVLKGKHMHIIDMVTTNAAYIAGTQIQKYSQTLYIPNYVKNNEGTDTSTLRKNFNNRTTITLYYKKSDKNTYYSDPQCTKIAHSGYIRHYKLFNKIDKRTPLTVHWDNDTDATRTYKGVLNEFDMYAYDDHYYHNSQTYEGEAANMFSLKDSEIFTTNTDTSINKNNWKTKIYNVAKHNKNRYIIPGAIAPYDSITYAIRADKLAKIIYPYTTVEADQLKTKYNFTWLRTQQNNLNGCNITIVDDNLPTTTSETSVTYNTRASIVNNEEVDELFSPDSTISTNDRINSDDKINQSVLNNISNSNFEFNNNFTTPTGNQEIIRGRDDWTTPDPSVSPDNPIIPANPDTPLINNSIIGELNTSLIHTSFSNIYHQQISQYHYLLSAAINKNYVKMFPYVFAMGNAAVYSYTDDNPQELNLYNDVQNNYTGETAYINPVIPNFMGGCYINLVPKCYAVNSYADKSPDDIINEFKVLPLADYFKNNEGVLANIDSDVSTYINTDLNSLKFQFGVYDKTKEFKYYKAFTCDNVLLNANSTSTTQVNDVVYKRCLLNEYINKKMTIAEFFNFAFNLQNYKNVKEVTNANGEICGYTITPPYYQTSLSTNTTPEYDYTACPHNSINYDNSTYEATVSNIPYICYREQIIFVNGKKQIYGTWWKMDDPKTLNTYVKYMDSIDFSYNPTTNMFCDIMSTHSINTVDTSRCTPTIYTENTNADESLLERQDCITNYNKSTSSIEFDFYGKNENTYLLYNVEGLTPENKFGVDWTWHPTEFKYLRYKLDTNLTPYETTS